MEQMKLETDEHPTSRGREVHSYTSGKFVINVLPNIFNCLFTSILGVQQIQTGNAFAGRPAASLTLPRRPRAQRTLGGRCHARTPTSLTTHSDAPNALTPNAPLDTSP